MLLHLIRGWLRVPPAPRHHLRTGPPAFSFFSWLDLWASSRGRVLLDVWCLRKKAREIVIAKRRRNGKSSHKEQGVCFSLLPWPSRLSASFSTLGPSQQLTPLHSDTFPWPTAINSTALEPFPPQTPLRSNPTAVRTSLNLTDMLTVLPSFCWNWLVV